ncbi:MAG: hypothetical protein R3D32_15250 [Nitratireductor sp.]
MADTEIDAKKIEGKVHDLAAAMERIRNAQADRDDVVVEMKQAARTRLEMLAQELGPVFDALPPDNDQFEFALTAGETPRLWIDMTAFVRLARDRRVFEFVKDTRLGRTVLGETENRKRMAQMVTDYVAERVLEKERMIEGEWLSMKSYDFSRSGDEEVPVVAAAETLRKRSGWFTFFLFLLGILAGAAGMIAWAWFGRMPTL